MTRNIINNPRTPSLKCTNVNDKFTVDTSNGNGALTYPIGLITTDELTLSGAGVFDISDADNISYVVNPTLYLYTEDYGFLTMTPAVFSDDSASVGDAENGIVPPGNRVDSDNGGVRVVVSLKSDAITGGNGTMNNPFTVN